MRSTTACLRFAARSSTGLMTNRRTAIPACSTRWISLAMNVSETRGNPMRTYPTDGMPLRDRRTTAPGTDP
jgi:hypothetical protein